MKLLDAYIAKSVLAAIGLVTLMLTGLQIFILFVNQLDQLGKGDYGIMEAATFVMLQLPYEVYLFIPMASLLGCLIGLGIMANHRELVVMRAAGMSMWQMTLAVFKAAVIVMLIMTLIGEVWVPKMVRMANDVKMQALNGGQSLRTAHGIWLRHQNSFISIGDVLPGNVLQHVVQFQFNKAHQLRLSREMGEIKYEQGRWVAQNVAETRFYQTHTEVKHLNEMVWNIQLDPGFLQMGSSEPDEMTLQELYRYTEIKKKSHQAALSYQLTFWQRVIQPLTTLVMMLLAIPFIFGPLRSSTMGSKLLVGATVGFGFHIINRFFGSVSQVYQWPPEAAAVGPTIIFALLGLYLMKRSK